MASSSVRQLPYCPPVVRRSAPFLPLFLVKRDMLKQRKGFTLIELLIVVVIIGILAAIAIPKFANTKQKAVRSSMISDLRNLATAQEAFYADSTRYAGSYSSTLGSNSVNFSPSQNNVMAITTGGSGSYW